jgi:hypothetical protein
MIAEELSSSHFTHLLLKRKDMIPTEIAEHFCFTMPLRSPAVSNSAPLLIASLTKLSILFILLLFTKGPMSAFNMKITNFNHEHPFVIFPRDLLLDGIKD